MSTGVENPGIDAAQTFVEYFVIEDEDGSILRDDLYYAYVVWAAQRGHETVSEQQFFELLAEQVSFKTTAITANMEWVQRFDGLAISLVDAF
ncbi:MULTISPECIES: hypothetical protein [Halococcus]|uniref:Conjugation protein n=1 Tax=Halococcus salifodinae DSM 8989 TaxID=1227456 RepID=M0N6S2_9EURY|nr:MULTISPECIES: hypothetical protein [Halococcus]EMA53622.1 conjugation protein [Halococcus salifodinae DSM 8989]